jgi:hypothetical protein
MATFVVRAVVVGGLAVAGWLATAMLTHAANAGEHEERPRAAALHMPSADSVREHVAQETVQVTERLARHRALGDDIARSLAERSGIRPLGEAGMMPEGTVHAVGRLVGDVSHGGGETVSGGLRPVLNSATPAIGALNDVERTGVAKLRPLLREVSTVTLVAPSPAKTGTAPDAGKRQNEHDAKSFLKTRPQAQAARLGAMGRAGIGHCRSCAGAKGLPPALPPSPFDGHDLSDATYLSAGHAETTVAAVLQPRLSALIRDANAQTVPYSALSDVMRAEGPAAVPD